MSIEEDQIALELRALTEMINSSRQSGVADTVESTGEDQMAEFSGVKILEGNSLEDLALKSERLMTALFDKLDDFDYTETV